MVSGRGFLLMDLEMQQRTNVPALATSVLPDDPLDVLFYEVQMLNRVFDGWAKTSTDMARNAMLESFLLHLRNLIEFFHERPKDKDDLRVQDFCDKFGKHLPSTPSTMPKRNINKHLSHMTKRRGQGRVNWQCRDLLVQMNKTVERFIEGVADSYFPTRSGMTKNDFLIETKTLSIQVMAPVSATSSICSTIVIKSTLP